MARKIATGVHFVIIFQWLKNDVKEKWITSVDEIINNIRKWVEEPVKNNLVEIIDEEVEINEERLGKYKINSLAIRSLWDTVYIRPIGRMILGAIGRIDILSTKGTQYY